jgi:hypothetical protein
LERVRVRTGQVANVVADDCGMIYRNLHRRVARNEVAAKNISLGSRCDSDPVDIAKCRVLLYRVVFVASINETYAEVVPLSYVAISKKPVLTEPVAGCAEQSYSSAGVVWTPIPNGDIASELVIRGARDKDPRAAVGG